MFQILPESSGNLVCIKAVGKLTDADYRALIPPLEAIMVEHGSFKLFADLEEFDGWEWLAAWDDFAFGLKHWNNIEKIALIGTARWEELAAKIADKLMPSEVRFFPLAERANALTWIS